jgi:DNA-binding transcriptional ArsR family regulator
VSKRTPLEAAPSIETAKSARDIARLESVFKALADENRILMLNAFAKDRYLSVSDLAPAFGLSQSRASHHVKKLVEAGLIEGGRTGNFIWYSLVDEAFERLAALFAVE